MSNEIILCACGCGELFNRFDSRGRERKYIHGHYSRLQPSKAKDVTCENCGRVFKRPQWHRKRVKHNFCNAKCEGEWSTKNNRRKGENNGNYNTISVDCAGGCGEKVTKAASLINRRNGRVYCHDCTHLVKKGRNGFYVGYPKSFSAKLRKEIRQRDNYTCQECNKAQKRIGYTLHVHHIDYNKHNSDPMNLISLCRSCHGVTNFSTTEWQTKLESIMLGRFPDRSGGLPR